MKEAPGERVAKRTRNAKIATVTAKIAAVSAKKETAEMTVNRKSHPEVLMMVSGA